MKCQTIKQLTPATGTYALIYACRKSELIRIGKLGSLKLCPGYYLYVGSAFGPGGIRARVGRHVRDTYSKRWHVDYLKPHCQLVQLWVAYSKAKRETAWVKMLAQLQTAIMPLPGFGASDTSAVSHLFHFKVQPQISTLTGDSILFNDVLLFKHLQEP